MLFPKHTHFHFTFHRLSGFLVILYGVILVKLDICSRLNVCFGKLYSSKWEEKPKSRSSHFITLLTINEKKLSLIMLRCTVFDVSDNAPQRLTGSQRYNKDSGFGKKIKLGVIVWEC